MTPQQLWQAQSAGAPPVTLEYVRYRTANLTQETSGKHRRVFVITALASLQLLWNLFHMYAGMPIMQVSTVYMCVVAWINIVFWFKRSKVAPVPSDAGVLGSLQFYRRELERQRDLVKGTFARIVLLPLPGVVGMFSSFILEPHRGRGVLVWFLGIFLVFIASLVTYTNAQHRRRFQKEIEAVNLLLR